MALPLASEVKTLPAAAPVDILTVLLNVAAPVAVKAVNVDVPDAVKELKLVAPVTPNVPPTVSLFVTLKLVSVEVPDAVNDVNVVAPVTFTVEEKVAAPPCAEVDDNVVAPVTPKVPPIVPLPLTVELVTEEVPADKTPVNVNDVPVAAPMTGVTKVGVLANTNAPVPVSSDIAFIKFKLVGVAKNDAIPVPKPLTPVAIGKPVAFVNIAEVGVPKIGVVKVGLVNVLLVKVSVPDSVASVPVEPGSVMVVVPATAGATKFAVPEVEPL